MQSHRNRAPWVKTTTVIHPGASRGQRSPMKLSATNENSLRGEECGGVALPYGPQLFSDTEPVHDATHGGRKMARGPSGDGGG